MKMNLRKAGGISAIISAASYVFAIGLYLTMMMPLADSTLGIHDYMALFIPMKQLVFIWTFSMYVIHGVSLVVLVAALRERFAGSSSALAVVASAFGFIWTGFVLLSGFINVWGNEALVALYGEEANRAESFRIALTLITLGIDSSDRLLGSLWVALVSLASYRTKSFPRILDVFGMALGAGVLLAGLILPVNDPSASLLFGFGAIVWWLALGICMMRKNPEQQVVSDITRSFT